jgi:hypothetical protein
VIVPLLIAVIVDQADAGARRARLLELKNRLGLGQRRQGPVGLLGRMMHVKAGPHYDSWVDEVLTTTMEAAGVPGCAAEHELLHRFRNEGDTETGVGIDLAPPVVTRLDPLVPWLAREIYENRIAFPAHVTDENEHDHIADDDFYPDVIELIDWFHATGPDLMQLQIVEALDLASEWHGQIIVQRRSKAGDVLILKGQETVKRWEDGWSLVRLTHPQHLRAETRALGHCIGEGGYDRQILQPDQWSYYSLRDPEGCPRVTFEVRLNEDITQARGRRNLPPSGRVLKPALRAAHSIRMFPGAWAAHTYEELDLEALLWFAEQPGVTLEEVQELAGMYLHWRAMQGHRRTDIVSDVGGNEDIGATLKTAGLDVWLRLHLVIRDGQLFEQVFVTTKGIDGDGGGSRLVGEFLFAGELEEIFADLQHTVRVLALQQDHHDGEPEEVAAKVVARVLITLRGEAARPFTWSSDSGLAGFNAKVQALLDRWAPHPAWLEGQPPSLYRRDEPFLVELLDDEDHPFDDPTLEDLYRLQEQITVRIEELLDEHFPEVGANIGETAYLATAGMLGHGVGLWEHRETWHEELEPIVEADTEMRRLIDDADWR